MIRIIDWLFTNYKGEKISKPWFIFNIASLSALFLGILTLLFS